MTNDPAQRGAVQLLVLGILLSSLGAGLCYLGSLPVGPAALTLNETMGSLLFWLGAAVLLLGIPLRPVVNVCLAAFRTKLGIFVFPAYLVTHLIVYGFLLELMLASVYGISYILTPSLVVTTEAFSPPSLVNTFFDVSFNPSISFEMPPVLSGALSFYAITVAVLVALLVLGNMAKVRELRRASAVSRRTASYVLVPSAGLLLGASCCISVPALVSYAFPTVATGQIFNWIYDTSYFFFPAFAVVILYLNFIATERILRAKRRESTIQERYSNERKNP